MGSFLLFLLLSCCSAGLSLTSCAHTRYIPMPEHHSRDSLSKSVNVLVNTTYVDRTHTLTQRGDTVFKTDSIYVEKLRDIELHDTIIVTQRDSIPYPVEVMCPSRRTPLSPFHRGDAPRFYRTCTLGFFLILLCIILYVFLRIYLRR